MLKAAGRIQRIFVYLGMFAILYLFYRSFWVIILLLPCIMIYRKIHRREQAENYRALLRAQFKDFLDSLAASLRAGYSVENALRESQSELLLVHGEDSPICLELNRMLNQISLGMPVEEVFQDLANRTNVDDIETFASVFRIVRRTGGDLTGISKKAARDLADKLDTGNEIAVIISAKKLELRVISVIPAGLIGYMNLTGEDLLDPLYGNVTGVLIMTVCLCVYGAAVLLGRRLIRIEL